MPIANCRPIPELTREQIERFLSKVTISSDDDCWIWTGSVNEHGYGGIRINYQLFKAARVAYALHYKRDPESLHVCHRCDNPPCCNPHHLFLGTVKQNSDDSVKKGRSKILYKYGDLNPARLYPEKHIRGEATYNAKLTSDQVREIRRRAGNGESRVAMAAEYGIHVCHLTDIIYRRKWRHIN